MEWIIGLLIVAVVLLFQISQRLRPVASYFAKKDDALRSRRTGVESGRWDDWKD